MFIIQIKNKKIKTKDGYSISVIIYELLNNSQYHFETFIFLNSSYYNQNQWKKVIFQIGKKISKNNNYRFLTYDYSGVGESDFRNKNIQTMDFIKEFKAVYEFSKSEKVNIIGMSIGSWLGLNLVINYGDLIKSYLGIGNLAPYHNSYKNTVLRFKKIEDSIKYFESLGSESINESNWNEIFKRFYKPFFFENLDFQKHSNTFKNIVKRAIYPLIYGIDIRIFKQYKNFLTNTIIMEGDNILKQLDSLKLIIPIYFMTGDLDNIAHKAQSEDLHKRIHNSKLKIINNFGHGSILIGKGYDTIINEYLNFLKLYNN